MKVIATLLLGFILLVGSLSAWNATGHKIISAMVYDQLTPTTRARVDALISSHPDYQSHFLRDVPANATPAVRARWAFINASVWPDQIRDDPRFYNEERADAKPTPTLPGFPDMGRHTRWHYIGMPFTQDGTPLHDAEVPNAITEIGQLTNAIVTSPFPAYSLVWLEHLVEDIHNPIHTVSRFSSDNPAGDRNGGLVYVTPGKTLHAFWDDLGGTSVEPSYIDREAKKLVRTGTKRSVNVGPLALAQEGAEEARKFVYVIGKSSGTTDHPILLSVQYQNNAKRLHREDFSAAAARLAAILNGQLK